MVNYGFVVMASILNFGVGTIDPLTGACNYDVTFEAVFFRPFKNEVLDVIVATVDEEWIEAKMGPLTCHLSREKLDGYDFDVAQRLYADDKNIIKQDSIIRVRVTNFQIHTREQDIVAIVDLVKVVDHELD
eukprot:TRINITY_DN973_c0_g1_i2.p1 TRINITY_DN973_c0_g1~~TRINITY_DN973_c0_g1_i2.p1  ORF type:complete len:131 (-),score=30.20 TRINITY_DN973_c0_g1_i2:221-613(-)